MSWLWILAFIVLLFHQISREKAILFKGKFARTVFYIKLAEYLLIIIAMPFNNWNTYYYAFLIIVNAAFGIYFASSFSQLKSDIFNFINFVGCPNEDIIVKVVSNKKLPFVEILFKKDSKKYAETIANNIKYKFNVIAVKRYF